MSHVSSLECPTDVRQLLWAALHVAAILCCFRASSCVAGHSAPAFMRGIACPSNPSQRTCAVLHVQSSFASARAPSCLSFQSMNKNPNRFVIPPKFSLRIQLGQSQHSYIPLSLHLPSISSLEVLEFPAARVEAPQPPNQNIPEQLGKSLQQTLAESISIVAHKLR